MDQRMEILRHRVRLLSRGVRLPDLSAHAEVAQKVTSAMGVGPAGKRTRVFGPDGVARGMISLPLYRASHPLHGRALPSTLEGIDGPEMTLRLEDGTRLAVAWNPLPSDHPYGTRARVFGFECRHATTDEGTCRFCGVREFGQLVHHMHAKRIPAEFARDIDAQVRAHGDRTVTITTGSFAEPDQVAREFIALLSELRGLGFQRPVHIQMEPVTDLSLLGELAQLCDSIGIFLESPFEEIRRRICPSKARLVPRERYFANWDAAVQAFGRNKVLSTLLLGFGEDLGAFVRFVEDLAERGVAGMPLFCRFYTQALAGQIPSYLEETEDALVQLHLEAARAMLQHGLRLGDHRLSGCIGCQGCTPMTESFAAVRPSSRA